MQLSKPFTFNVVVHASLSLRLAKNFLCMCQMTFNQRTGQHCSSPIYSNFLVFFVISQLQEDLIKLQAVLADFHLTHDLRCWVLTRLHGMCLDTSLQSSQNSFLAVSLALRKRTDRATMTFPYISLFAESKIRIIAVWQFLAFDDLEFRPWSLRQSMRAHHAFVLAKS